MRTLRTQRPQALQLTFYKTCTVCGDEKLLTDFYRDGKRRRSDCKTCNRKQVRSYYQAHRQERIAYWAQYRLRYPAKVRASIHSYYLRHRQRLLERAPQYQRGWYQRNKERLAPIRQQWRRDNSELNRLYLRRSARRRRAHMANVCNDLTTEEWEMRLLAFCGACAYCGTSENITQDHVIPISKGGEHSRFNVVPACLSCNCQKSDKL